MRIVAGDAIFIHKPAIADLEFAKDPDHPNAPPSSDFDPEGQYLYDQNGFLVAEGSGNGRPAQAYANNDNFFVTGRSTDNNISVSGGSDDINYYVKQYQEI